VRRESARDVQLSEVESSGRNQAQPSAACATSSDRTRCKTRCLYEFLGGHRAIDDSRCFVCFRHFDYFGCWCVEVAECGQVQVVGAMYFFLALTV